MGKKNEYNKARIGRIIWLYTKYQLITKGLTTIVIFPLFSLLVQYLIRSTGRTNISSGDYIKFLLSFQGLGMLILAIVLLTILVGLDINAFIIMSALIKENKMKMSAKDMIYVGIKSLRSFLRPSGLFLLLYVALIVPLVSIGVTVSSMQNFQIPNFITSVIFSNPLYKFLYIGLMILLAFVTIFYIFVFHYVLISKDTVKDALKKSSALMKNHWKNFIKDMILKGAILGAIIAGIIFGLLYIMVVPAYLLPSSVETSRFFTLFTILIIVEFISFLAFMAVPIVVSKLTTLFYKYNEEDGNPIEFVVKENKKGIVDEVFSKIRLRTKLALSALVIIIIVGNIIISGISTYYFEEIFNPERRIDIIAHRGGGDLAAENSIKGLEEAIKEGASWSEIDVQRTKDGHYIINHDPNFARVAGISKAPIEMSLEEIKNLEVADLFDESRPSQKVATLEEFLDAAKGKIGLFVELKGKTADEKMVDDVVKMIKDRKMETETALLSLDYDLIKYIDKNYPEMDSGFLYFFSIGDTASMNGDYLIMEEREANPDRVAEIQDAGKKAIVWTVNTSESINKFVRSEVDGIITDHVKDVKDAMIASDQRSDIDLIMDTFFGN
ncbi:MAG: glycerophosphoryl diester phosphodiesterase membrane domain-containing protein [Tissierellia bacterium]|nr:glycerophosphoryl diester phosphodiesterase membrane domain-containing protein [Tissierellia bacterium]